MEMHDALEFCLQRLRAEPQRILALAAALAAPAAEAGAAIALPAGQRPAPAGEGANRAVLQASQEVLAQTLACLRQDRS